MITQMSSESFSASFFRRVQYSRAVAGSWREHGPHITRRRSDFPMMISTASRRPWSTVLREASLIGISDRSKSGAINGSCPRTAIRKSISVFVHESLSLWRGHTASVVGDEAINVENWHFDCTVI